MPSPGDTGKRGQGIITHGPVELKGTSMVFTLLCRGLGAMGPPRFRRMGRGSLSSPAVTCFMYRLLHSTWLNSK